jgi:hypothetical protein
MDAALVAATDRRNISPQEMTAGQKEVGIKHTLCICPADARSAIKKYVLTKGWRNAVFTSEPVAYAKLTPIAVVSLIVSVTDTLVTIKRSRKSSICSVYTPLIPLVVMIPSA